MIFQYFLHVPTSYIVLYIYYVPSSCRHFLGFWHPKPFHYSKATSAGNAVHQSSASSGPIMDSIRGAVAFTNMDENSGTITPYGSTFWGSMEVFELPSGSIWLFNIAMENPNHKWRFIAGKIIYKWAIYTMAMLVITRRYIYIYPLNMVVFHSYVSHNQRVFRFVLGSQVPSQEVFG